LGKYLSKAKTVKLDIFITCLEFFDEHDKSEALEYSETFSFSKR